jgi:hypothetical protein
VITAQCVYNARQVYWKRFIEYELARCKVVCVMHHAQHAERVFHYLMTASALARSDPLKMAHLSACLEYNARIKAQLTHNKHLIELPAEAHLEWRRKADGPSNSDLLGMQLQVFKKVRLAG